MAILDVEIPPRILVGVFPRSVDLWSAQANLVANGIALDFIGAIVKGDKAHKGNGHSQNGNMLSVIVPIGRASEVEAIMKNAGATTVSEPADLHIGFKDIPHPGMIEDHDLKLPSGREFPETSWPPALSGHRTKPATLGVRDRVSSFDEVELDYTLQDALTEAKRCLNCPDAPCRTGCPAHNEIPSFIRAIRDRDFSEGAAFLRKTTNLPDVCGRVCDKARQCEGACTLKREGGDAVAIGALERFLAAWEVREGQRRARLAMQSPPGGKKVAIVGSGPSGLAAAGDLAFRGHKVTVFESLPVLGGALAWGIPAFRLPPAIVQGHLDYLRDLGVEFRLRVKVGVDITPDQLFEQGYHAIFIGAGASIPSSMGVPGEGLQGIYSATEFLTRSKLSRTHDLPEIQPPIIGEKLVVVGGGNTAMDVAQTALRLGAAGSPDDQQEEHTTMDVAETALRLGFCEVTVVYRRSEQEMPARKEEVDEAREEGTRFRFLTTPVRFIGDANGRVAAMECIEMELGQPDARGRRNPVPKTGSEFIMPVDTVVLALGYRSDAALSKSFRGVETDKEGLFITDRETGRTNRAGIWAGGDIVTGADTVVRAMVAGKRAARDIEEHLKERL